MSHQLEQLLTCCICLDRYRNPKLLPCQHSVCMEPCMEGLVDYVRRQVKCPECRAEHRIPYNGVQGFPSNVTLQRFLEAQIEITGETPDPHTGQFMERCAVCNEKNYLTVCAHCEKKVCDGCRAAHSEVLKREIGRINNQVKRAAHRLTEQLQNVQRSITSMQSNTSSVVEEIENISKRLQKAIRDRGECLISEVQNQYNTELRSMQMLKDGLELEIANVQSNIELADKHMDDDTPWDDSELMDTKDIFLKTMEFIRSFDYDTGGEYGRKMRFLPPDDLNKLASSLSTMGELSTPAKHTDPYAVAQSFGSGGLAKSKSDHRLAVQFRDQEDAFGGRTSPVSRRRFGERPPPVESSHDSAYESDSSRRRFRSRFMKREEDEEKGVRFSDDETSKPVRVRCIDTEDVSRGPLSGIARIVDSPRVIQRLQERDQIIKNKKEEASKPTPTPTPKPATTAALANNPYAPKKTARQVSEDEIDKIKKQNKSEEIAASSSGAAAVTSSTPTSYGTTTLTVKSPSERVSSLREEDKTSRTDYTSSSSPRSSIVQTPSAVNDEDTSLTSSRRRDYNSSRTTDYSTSGAANGTSSRTPSRKTSVDAGVVSIQQRAQPFSRSSSTSSIGESTKVGTARSSHTLDTSSIEKRLSRSNSTDSNKSYDGATSPRKATGAAFSTDELRNRFGRTTTDTSSKISNTYPRSSTTSSTTGTGTGSTRFQSRFLGRAGTPSVEASKESGNDEEEESSEESESEDSEESSEEEEDKDKSSYSRSGGGLLGRSAQNTSSSTSSSYKNTKSLNDSGYGSRYGSSSDNSNASTSTRYGTSNDTSSTSSYRRPSILDNKKDDDHDSKYSFASKYSSRNKTSVPEEETKPAFQSRFLNRSKSSAILGPDGASISKPDDSPPAMGAGRARFEELKEKRQRLARSKSSAGLDDDDVTTTETTSPSTYKSKYSRDNDTTSSSVGTRALGASSSSSPSGRDDGGSTTAQLSNWARYLKNKYGNKTGPDSTTGVAGSSSISSASPSSSLLSRTGVSSTGSSGIGSSSSSASTASARALARSRSSHLFGLAKDGESSEDDSSKNADATPTTPVKAGILVVPTPIGSIHRNQYLKKQHLLLQIGSRGSEPGNFTWPRGVAVGPDNSIVVADSSNHRVQVFDQNARFLKEFGSYGSGQGEFDCLAGVAVNRIGQYIIADRYNHRIQVFDPSGMFLRSFGSQGSGEGRFSYPWGVTTDALGFIYVCDKENHRVQVFQSDGTFVGRFGSLGNKQGQLEHPHYIAVSSTNRVIVSDSNNHRIQIFDINGKVQTSFGGEGAEEGQFKFPRGVAVDEQGYIVVADSGNNRIQVFQSDGSFLRAFGCWGSMDGEFKGLEGVAVMPNGNILVCDRENHRVQIF